MNRTLLTLILISVAIGSYIYWDKNIKPKNIIIPKSEGWDTEKDIDNESQTNSEVLEFMKYNKIE